MAFVLWLFMALVPSLLGMGALRILYGSQWKKEMSPADCILTGGMILLGLAEAAHLGAVVLGWSFSRCVSIYLIEIIVIAVLAALVLLIGRLGGKKASKEHPRKQQLGAAEKKALLKAGVLSREGLLWGLFAILALGQLIYVYTGQGVYVDGDMTLETVNSFLASDRIYEINPLTGKAYAQGIPLRLEILCLPTLYGMLSQLFGVGAEALVYGMIPAFVLLGSYLAFYTVANHFFAGESGKKALFMLLVAVLMDAGDYMYGMDGFGALHSGFRGAAIRGAILLPYTIGLMLRRKYRLVILCIAAEACVVWTLYGMGACLLVTVGLWVVEKGLRLFDARKSGEEATKCWNS